MKNKLSILAALCALFVLIAASQDVIESCRYGLRLCTEMILPSLFPFFVLSTLLGKLGFPVYLGRLLSRPAAKLFRVSGAGISALFIGLTGGYPLGAGCIADLVRAGSISEKEAEHLLAFCNNSGPAFLVGAVGVGVFGSVRLGLLLYAVHILAAVLTGLLLRGCSAPRTDGPLPLPPDTTISQALPEAVRQSVLALLNVCGFVVCFTAFAGLLDANGFFNAAAAQLSALTGTEPQWARALLTGLLELGGGIGALRGLPPAPLNLALAAGLLGWGGVSVHFQTIALLADTNIKGTLHTAGRLLSAILSFAMAYGLGLVFYTLLQ